jgi:tRNA threonylcarbamoyladenosine modification (KEOPS) complex Cgi121 subunit
MINDDLAFPLKYPIEYPIIDKQFAPRSIYMDRRYHISPPGETTQYRVDEYYLENDIIEKDEKTNALKAQELGYKKIIEICNKSVKGEILFFANGQREILEAVKYLNSVLPSGNIALPYFADMHEIYKEIISKINNKISQIKNKRERIHEDWGVNFIEDPSIPNDIYKRAIIIATNVAEASVTIPGLTYVVDNGYSKVNLYDKEFSISNLEVEKISESSRLQRKGRVGRVGDGTVYYMYKKDARKNIKPKYKITQENLPTYEKDILCVSIYPFHDESLWSGALQRFIV